MTSPDTVGGLESLWIVHTPVLDGDHILGPVPIALRPELVQRVTTEALTMDEHEAQSHEEALAAWIGRFATYEIWEAGADTAGHWMGPRQVHGVRGLDVRRELPFMEGVTSGLYEPTTDTDDVLAEELFRQRVLPFLIEKIILRTDD